MGGIPCRAPMTSTSAGTSARSHAAAPSRIRVGCPPHELFESPLRRIHRERKADNSWRVHAAYDRTMVVAPDNRSVGDSGILCGGIPREQPHNRQRRRMPSPDGGKSPADRGAPRPAGSMRLASPPPASRTVRPNAGIDSPASATSTSTRAASAPSVCRAVADLTTSWAISAAGCPSRSRRRPRPRAGRG